MRCDVQDDDMTYTSHIPVVSTSISSVGLGTASTFTSSRPSSSEHHMDITWGVWACSLVEQHTNTTSHIHTTDMYTYTCTDTCTCACTCTSTSIHMYLKTHTFRHAHTHAHAHTSPIDPSCISPRIRTPQRMCHREIQFSECQCTWCAC